MSNTNAFLKEFLAMRKSLTPAPVSAAASSKAPEDVLPKNKNGRKPKAEITKDQQTDKPGLMTIVENKPHKRVVIEYLQHKANDLTEEKMR